MGFHVNTDSIPSLGSYERADRHERAVTPIRGNGKNAGIKPIGARHAAHMSIRRERNVISPLGNDGDAVVCKLYETDCVIFFEDGSSKIRTGGWDTQSTVKFIDAVIDYHAWIKTDPKRDAMLYCNHGKKFLWRDSVSLDPDRMPIDDEPCVIHKTNRKAMNEVRKLNEPFRKYVKSMVKVAYGADSCLERDVFVERCEKMEGLGAIHSAYHRDTFPDNNDVFTLCNIMREDNIEDWADALEVFALMTMESRWNGSNLGRWESAYFFMPQRINKLVDEVLKYGYADSVFYEIELPRGEYRPDFNLKYVEGR